MVHWLVMAPPTHGLVASVYLVIDVLTLRPTKDRGNSTAWPGVRTLLPWVTG